MTDAPPVGNLPLKVFLLTVISAAVGFLAAKRLELGMVPGAVIAIAILGVGIFAVLKLAGAPREMWFTFGLKFCSMMAYKVLNVTLVLWLAEDIGYSKEEALGLIAGWSIMMSIATLLVGSITDAIGVRRTLLLGVTVCVLTRAVMVVTTEKWLMLTFGLFPLAVGEALCTPVLVAALRKYSSARQRSVAFSLFYAIGNLAFMAAYFISDGVRESVRLNGALSLPLGGGELSGYRTVLLASMIIELCMAPIILLLRRGAEVTELGLCITPEVTKYPGVGSFTAARLTVRDAGVDTWRLFAGLVRQAGFYRLLSFLLMIGFLKVVFNSMDYLLPTFAKQELGPEVRYGSFNAINGILIVMLAPVVGILTQKYSAYAMVIFGGFITALSFVFLVLPTTLFQGVADGWFGDAVGHGYMQVSGAVHPYYVMIILWQVAFSIGEAFYSPRVYEYAASIAPKGQEASYASLSYIPLLIGKLITGAVFGPLLAYYCPDEGSRSPGTMWMIVGLLVCIAPVGLLLLRRFIRVKEEGREE